jgi:hypothetical protein
VGRFAGAIPLAKEEGGHTIAACASCRERAFYKNVLEFSYNHKYRSPRSRALVILARVLVELGMHGLGFYETHVMPEL